MGGESVVKGSWERSITLFRTTQSSVVQSLSAQDAPRQVVGTLWFGPHAAHGTVYVPILSGVLDVPPMYKIGWEGELDRKASYWAHRYVANLCDLKFKFMIQDVQAGQRAMEDTGEALRRRAIDLARGGGYTPEQMTQDVAAHGQAVLDAWWKLADTLMVKYADGWYTPDVKHIGEGVGYPKWWLEAVGYANGPPPPPKDTHSAHT